MKKFKFNRFFVLIVIVNILLLILRLTAGDIISFQGNFLSLSIFIIIIGCLLYFFISKKYDYFILIWLSFYFAVPIIKLPFTIIGSLGILNAIFIPLIVLVTFRPKDKYILLILALILLSIFNFSSAGLRLVVSSAFEFIAPLLFFYFVIKKCKNPDMIIWGSIFISLINIPLTIYEIIVHPAWGGLADWRGFRIFGNLFWHNSYSIYLLPSLLILYSALRVKFSKWMLFFFIVLLAGNIFTLSRSGLLSLVMGMLIFEFLFQSGSKQKFKSITMVLLFILALIAYTFLGLQESSLGPSAIGERTGIWESIFPLIHNIILGNGLGSYELYRGDVLHSLAPHNSYLGLIFELGLIGLFLVGLFLYNIIKAFYHKLKLKNLRVTGALGLSLIISLLIYSLVGGVAFSQVVALNSWVILGCLMI